MMTDNFTKNIDKYLEYDENLRLRIKIEKLENLIEATGLIASTFKLDKLLDMVMEIGMEMMNAEGCSILLLDEEGEKLQFVAVSGKKKDDLKNMTIKPGEGIAGWVVKNGESLLIKDVSSDDRFSNRVDRKLKQTTKSIICVPLEIKGKIIGAAEVINRKDGRPFDEESLSLFRSLAIQSAVAIERSRLYADLNDLFFSTIKTLASAIDAKDHYTQGHSERVSEYSIEIGKTLNLDENELTKLELSAMLHDIGKIGIPEKILTKKTFLDDKERKEIQKHPGIGARMLVPIKQFGEIISCIRHHHERYGGGGYPDGIKGEAIPFFSRIIAVADTFDAMTSNRPYRKAFSSKQAVGEIKKFSGIQFDPKCVKSFLKASAKGKIKNNVHVPRRSAPAAQ